jgi:cytochrome c biogenesis factor
MGGAFLMALGGFIAMSDRRYRLAVKQRLAAMAGVPA